MRPRAWLTFITVSILWGVPYFFIKVAIDEGVPPAFLAWARVLLGAGVLGLLAWRLDLLGGLRGRWRAIGLYALVEIAVPFPLIAAGEQEISSSLAAILIATVPLLIALLALRFDQQERVRGVRVYGLVLGFAGVVALVGLDVAGSGRELLGAGFVLVAALGYAIGPMVLKRHLGDLDPRALMAAALAVASVVLAPLALIAPPTETPSTYAVVSLVILGILCTAAALSLFAALIIEVGPSRASVVTYVSPVVAVVLGVAALGERPGVGAIVGMALIIAGSWLATAGRVPPRAAGLALDLRSRLRRGV